MIPLMILSLMQRIFLYVQVDGIGKKFELFRLVTAWTCTIQKKHSQCFACIRKRIRIFLLRIRFLLRIEKTWIFGHFLKPYLSENFRGNEDS